MATVLRLQSRISCLYASSSPSLLILSRHCSTTQESPEKIYPIVSSEPANLKRGTGGRSSFSGKVVTVFGASGFLGRAVVSKLGRSGCQVIVPYRGVYDAVHRLKVCGDLGQIMFLPFNLKDEESVHKAIKHANVVINLIGKNHETGNFPFEEVHVKGPRRIAKFSRDLGIETFIHVSALNACESPKPVIFKKGSQFLASKWRGEQAVREEFPDAVIVRPSDMFGSNDKFCSYYGKKMRHTFNAMSLWNKGVGIFKQPVFYSDVAEAILKATFDSALAGKIIQAVGPHRYELCEMVDWFHRVMMYSRKSNYFIFDMRFDLLLWLKAFITERSYFRYKRVTYERLEREHITDVVDPHLSTLEDLGIELTKLEDRIFFEMKHYRAHGYFDIMQQYYRRPVDPAPHVPA